MFAQDQKLNAMQRGNSASTNDHAPSTGQILSANQLVYKLPSSLAVAESRTTLQFYSVTDTARNGQTSIIPVETGSAYVCPKHSFLSFSFYADCDDREDADGTEIDKPSYFTDTKRAGHASLIQSIILVSRTGVELSRLDNANLFISRYLFWSRNSDYSELVSRGMGGYDGGADTFELEDGVTYGCSIPLWLFAGIWSADVLIPAHVLSGARFHIVWERPETALQWESEPYGNEFFRCSDICLNLDAYLLGETADMELQRISAKSGLELTHIQVASISEGNVRSQNFEQHIQKSCSRANMVFSVVRDEALLFSKTDNSFDSSLRLDGTTGAIEDFQFRLGSTWFPHQKLEKKQNPQKFWLYNCMNFGTLGTTRPTDGKNEVISSTLERSSVLKHSGQSTNNSRSLSVNITFDSSSQRNITSFLMHTAVIRSNLHHVSLSI